MKNKLVIRFIGVFFTLYLLLSFFYKVYLNNFESKHPEKVDKITEKVAVQSVQLGKIVGWNFKTEMHPNEPSMKFFFNNHYISRIVEGCNAISVLILFWSFIIAFKGKIFDTIVFGLLGTLLIYGINLLRIIFLSYLMYHYFQYYDFLHKILFPIIIYGFTFILWIFWVKIVERSNTIN